MYDRVSASFCDPQALEIVLNPTADKTIFLIYRFCPCTFDV